MMLGARTAAWSGKPLPYDAEVEYLESTGTQYIDTRFRPGLDFIDYGCYCDFSIMRLDVNCPLFSCRGANTGNTSFGLWNIANDRIRFDWKSSVNYNGSVTVESKHSFKKNNSENNWYIDESVYSLNTGGYVSIPETMLIFANRSAGSGSISIFSFVRIYNFKYTNPIGTPIFDMIPVRVGSLGFMYDKVSGSFLGNEGTGAFVIGPDKT